MGLAYTPAMLHNKVVLHAGCGLYDSPFNDDYTPQTYGFSSTVAQFGAPNVTPTSSSLGTITSQQNTPRVIQQGLRLVF